MFMRIAAFCLLTAIGFPSAGAQDKKKHMTVHVGSSTRQIYNHPWSHTTPGQANTNCSTNGTVSATGTTIGSNTSVSGSVNADTDCTTTYRPPTTRTGNRVTVENASWVMDTASGDEYLIECMANWIASKCSLLDDGDYKAALEGNNMWVTGMKGMKEMTAKYHILKFVSGGPHSRLIQAPVKAQVAPPNNWREDERHAWESYNAFPEDDKKYVRDLCSANPTARTLLPRAKARDGSPGAQTFFCASWVHGKTRMAASGNSK